MLEKEKVNSANQELVQSIEQLRKQLDLLEKRLDNLDSITTAVVERVMRQPIALNITCPICGKTIEIDIIGREKAKR